MSTDTEESSWKTPRGRAVRVDRDKQGKSSGPENSITVRRLSIEMSGLAVALVATVVMYVGFIVYPVEHPPLNEFLAAFGRGNAAIWPMQIVWYTSAVAMVGLAFWPRRRASQLICLLAAAYMAWIGIAYFAVLFYGTTMAWVSGLWAAAFILEGILLVAAGIVRHDLVFAPRFSPTSVLGAVFIIYALVAYPLIGLLGGHPLSIQPVFGLAPCPTAIFYFGLLLWTQAPTPKYLLLIPLAWSLSASPGAMATGVVADFILIPAGVLMAGVLIWRDRTSSWQTMVAGLVLVVMIAFSGHDDWEVVIGLVLVAVTVMQAIWGDVQQLHASRPPRPEGALTS